MTQRDEGSVTRMIGPLKSGDGDAAQAIWNRYAEKLFRLAREKLRRDRKGRRVEDEEDAVVSAFDSFCDNAKQGRYPQLADRHDLWRLLTVITICKAYDQIERRKRQKRGGNLHQVEKILTYDDELDALDMLIDQEPTPELAAMMAEQFQRLMGLLPDQKYRDIAFMKFYGYTREEIAERLDCSTKTVSNKLRFIRRAWEEWSIS
jgi:DNA-directed RNA polymerase specialized sigma24 family protein